MVDVKVCYKFKRNCTTGRKIRMERTAKLRKGKKKTKVQKERRVSEKVHKDTFLYP